MLVHLEKVLLRVPRLFVLLLFLVGLTLRFPLLRLILHIDPRNRASLLLQAVLLSLQLAIFVNSNLTQNLVLVQLSMMLHDLIVLNLLLVG